MYFSLPKCALILRIRVVGPWRIRTGSKVSKSKGALIANPGEIHSLGKVRANPKQQEVRWWGKQSHQVAAGVCTIQCPMRSCFKLSWWEQEFLSFRLVLRDENKNFFRSVLCFEIKMQTSFCPVLWDNNKNFFQSRVSRREREFLSFNLMLWDQNKNFFLSVLCFEKSKNFFLLISGFETTRTILARNFKNWYFCLSPDWYFHRFSGRRWEMENDFSRSSKKKWSSWEFSRTGVPVGLL